MTGFVQYQLATLTAALGASARVVDGVAAWDRTAAGTLLGCWQAEIGALNQVMVLRGFTDPAEAERERDRALHSADPFHCAADLTALEVDRYAAFPCLPPIAPGTNGPVYEVRTYTMKPGGLPAILETWCAALPARLAVSPLVTAMHTLDGVPRFTHIWPYPDLATRARVRSDVVAAGIWPPKGSSPWLARMNSTICVPTPFSPLR